MTCLFSFAESKNRWSEKLTPAIREATQAERRDAKDEDLIQRQKKQKLRSCQHFSRWSQMTNLPQKGLGCWDLMWDPLLISKIQANELCFCFDIWMVYVSNKPVKLAWIASHSIFFYKGTFCQDVFGNVSEYSMIGMTLLPSSHHRRGMNHEGFNNMSRSEPKKLSEK